MAEQAMKSVTAPKAANDQADVGDAKGTIESSHTSELVIALCGPIGSPLHRVAEALKDKLLNDFSYESCEIIRLSKFIEKHGSVPQTTSRFKRVKALIEAGDISQVFYIEPYRKSLATKLHYDAITEDESDQLRVRVLPYDGVAPTRFLKFFRVPQDSRKSGGKMIKPDPKMASPRFDKTLQALPELEALVVRELRDRNVL